MWLLNSPSGEYYLSTYIQTQQTQSYVAVHSAVIWQQELSDGVFIMLHEESSRTE